MRRHAATKPLYRDRREAGLRLAAKLSNYKGSPDLLVLGLPRGGVPIAYEVARSLEAPMDVFVVRKLGFPGNEELAMGAISGGGAIVFNEEIAIEAPQNLVEEVIKAERKELQRREERYRKGRPPPHLRGRRIILVDDGLATGATMRAAIETLRQAKPAEIVVAVPVGPLETCKELEAFADKLVCVVMPRPFYSLGTWYQDFDPPSDEDITNLLNAGEHVSARRGEVARS